MPSTSTSPSVGSYIRASRETTVDFPDPVGPTMATVAPAGTRNETPRSTSRSVPG